MAESKKPTGKPLRYVDYELFKKLCGIFCTQDEISYIMGLSVDSLEKWADDLFGCTLGAVWRKHIAYGKRSLRRAQLQNALKGNATMQIWLGKQFLGQSDNPLPDDKDETYTCPETMKL